MKEPLRSKEFDDVYFSAQDGLAETRHVFIEGNGLPAAWQGRKSFTIGETGFGTGLNFLAAWKLFDETAGNETEGPDSFLDFVSIEKFPLSPEEIREALSPWQEELGPYIEKFLEQYPIRATGFHRIVFEAKAKKRVALTLIFDDINEVLPQVDGRIDAWFLDGFTPAKNPEMWSETVFKEMARLSATNASFATFTAAGDVKRGLQEAGFGVQKQRGFGRKRDMLAGHFEGRSCPLPSKKSLKKIAIIGGGLAGTACAYVLKQYGFTPVIYEKEKTLAPGASGNRTGLYNPRLSVVRGPEPDFYTSAYAQTIRTLKNFQEVDFHPRGTLHLFTPKGRGENEGARFHRTMESWRWHSEHMRIVDADEASEIAGIELPQSALYLPDAGSVCPQKLCHAYAEGIETHLGADISDLESLKADAIVLACGAGIQNFLPPDLIPVHTVRGQVSLAAQTEMSAQLKTNLCYGGYICAAVDGQHVLGSTFQKWLSGTALLEGDHALNLEALKDHVPALAEGLEISGGRAGLRLATPDRFPLVGKVRGQSNIYLSAAYGSHGIVGSLAAAHLIADQLRGGPISLPMSTVYTLSAGRFSDRAAKKGRKRT